jgi:hypothetical protein
MHPSTLIALTLAGTLTAGSVRAEGDWEITPASERALALGLQWLAHPGNQGTEGNWSSDDLGLVGMGLLAFLADGHAPGRGDYGQAADRALAYILDKAAPSGLLNIANERRDMYNHGLATFVLGQAHGMSTDHRIQIVLDQALRVITDTQCQDGGWDYHARRQPRGHDLSLVVMQAKALRSAVDTGFAVPNEVVQSAIQCVRRHYTAYDVSPDAPESLQRRHPGQFTYTPQGRPTLAMAAAGVVCLQEFGQYDDWRIAKNMEVITKAIDTIAEQQELRQTPLDPYTLYYVGQALYQVGGQYWESSYPKLRDALVRSQVGAAGDPTTHGMWPARGHVGGKPGQLYATAAACFILAMPNRYLPILQEGRIEGLRGRYQ